ncbi:hypothetical protein [Bosea sp. AAP35]|uniref:hypothetical protein n=1 Tax=Bosea sp. AAP35 TaxID=1523417 RepID=UPI0012E1353C|nr:hypothetical protein [Bosea sp. AAP35]
MSDDFVGSAETRALQNSKAARESNYAWMLKWGAYNLLKVKARAEVTPKVSGYITLLTHISGMTPRDMELALGLRTGQLAGGADIYRLNNLPSEDGFNVRGYTTLVDGLRLKSDRKSDAFGYRPGQGAWQVELTTAVDATRIATLGPHDPFEPGLHPRVRAMYGH